MVYEDFHRGGLQSGHTRDSSLAVAAGGPQRWRPCCKPNLACGRWLVRSSLGSRGTGALKSERERGTHQGGEGGKREVAVVENSVVEGATLQ